MIHVQVFDPSLPRIMLDISEKLTLPLMPPLYIVPPTDHPQCVHWL